MIKAKLSQCTNKVV